MSDHDKLIEAIYHLSRIVENNLADISHRLLSITNQLVDVVDGIQSSVGITSHLEKINEQLTEINKNTPNILDRE